MINLFLKKMHFGALVVKTSHMAVNLITSRTLLAGRNLQTQIEELQETISSVRNNIKQEEEDFSKLDQEYGTEIARVKKEFARIKERSYEEASAISDAAKIAALKVLQGTR